MKEYLVIVRDAEGILSYSVEHITQKEFAKLPSVSTIMAGRFLDDGDVVFVFDTTTLEDVI